MCARTFRMADRNQLSLRQSENAQLNLAVRQLKRVTPNQRLRPNQRLHPSRQLRPRRRLHPSQPLPNQPACASTTAILQPCSTCKAFRAKNLCDGEGLACGSAAISLTAIPRLRSGLRGRGASAGAQSRPVLADMRPICRSAYPYSLHSAGLIL